MLDFKMKINLPEKILKLNPVVGRWRKYTRVNVASVWVGIGPRGV
jgi:hypothetical protein